MKVSSVKLSNVIKIGSFINLEVKNYIDSEEIIKLKTMIQGNEDDIIIVNLPTNDGTPFIPSSVAEIKAIISLDKMGIYTFYVKFVDKLLLDGIPCISLKIDSDIKKSQRRQYFRLNFLGEISISIEEFEDALVQYMEQPRVSAKIVEENLINGTTSISNKFLKANGKDISGGGFKANCRIPFDVNSEIHGKIALGNDLVPFNGTIVRCQEIDDDVDKFEIGVSFDEIDENVRSKIIAFIFERQRKLMNKR